jgi:prepilin-type N-terminal cleavage/methylation domain-containing protein
MKKRRVASGEWRALATSHQPPATRHQPLATQSGVTLIELLIAVSLVSLLSLGMLMAIRVGLNAMQKTNSRFIENRRVASIQRIVDSQIGGMMPIVSQCAAAGGARFIFFEGKPQTLRFVSSYSLQEAARGYARILEFHVARGDEGLRLLVDELIWPGPVTSGLLCAGIANGMPVFRQIEANPRSFVLADKLAYCRILYRRPLPLPEIGEVWLPDWPVPDRLPSGIRIEMAPLRAEPARLQVMTITAPVRLTKWVLGPYEDN